MDSGVKARRSRFAGGQLVLFRSKEMLDLFLLRLELDGLVAVQKRGRNYWDDRSEWPFYAFVVHKTDGGQLIDWDDVAYIDDIVDEVHRSSSLGWALLILQRVKEAQQQVLAKRCVDEPLGDDWNTLDWILYEVCRLIENGLEPAEDLALAEDDQHRWEHEVKPIMQRVNDAMQSRLKAQAELGVDPDRDDDEDCDDIEALNESILDDPVNIRSREFVQADEHGTYRSLRGEIWRGGRAVGEFEYDEEGERRCVACGSRIDRSSDNSPDPVSAVADEDVSPDVESAIDVKTRDILQRLSVTKDEILREVGLIDRAVMDTADLVQKQFSEVFRRIDSVANVFSTKIETLRMEEIRRAGEQAAKGDRQAADQIFEECSKRDAEAERHKQLVANLEQERKDLLEEAERQQNLLRQSEAQMGQYELDIQELRGEKAAWQTSRRWSQADIALIRALSLVNHGGAFWKHLRQRCPAVVSPDDLAKSIQQLLKGTKETKHLEGHHFCEYRCNLGRGHGTGRLYFDKRDDVLLLLGFGDDKDRQDDDIKQIERELRRSGGLEE